tara:strand:- start:247 stop:582 length:336 start_codon:yes stop_codon:yes gene_type:complete
MKKYKKVYVFDIDGTICTLTDGDYAKSEPIQSRIDTVNRLYAENNKIVFQTARGMGRTQNNSELAIKMFHDFTYNQLKSWGVNFHELFLGKPAGDIYVDDKSFNDRDFFTD